MFEWLRSFGRKAQQNVSLVSPWLKSVVWTISRSFLSLAREGYANNSIVYACLRLLSQSVPEAPLLAYTVGADREKKPVAHDHPLAQLIRQPNPLMTEYELIELITLHLGIVGRSHWWKQRDRAGRVVALWPLRPDRVGPRYGGAEDDDVTQDSRLAIISGWTYAPPGSGAAQFIPLDDMISFNHPDPAGETGGIVEGLGWVQVLAREIETDNEATTFVGALLKNNAMPGAILQTKTPNLSKDSADRIKRIFGQQFGGSQRGMTAVLDADTTYTAASFNLQQLEFPDLRNIAESRIAAAAGVPAVLVGLKVGIDAGIKATITEQRQYFSETTLANYWRRLADQFTNDLASEFGGDLIVAFDTTQVKALSEQMKAQHTPISDGFAAGAVTLDEYRVRVLHLPELPNGLGQVLYVPTTTTVTLQAELGAPPPPPPPPPLMLPPPPTKALRLPTGAKAADPALVATVRANADKRVADHTAVAAPGLTAYLADLGAAVVGRVEAANKDWHVPDANLITAEEAAKLADLVTAIWSAVLADAAADASALTGVAISGEAGAAIYAATFAGLAERVVGIDATTKAAIRAAVRAANLAGEGMPELAARIAALGEFGPNRAETIARTESGTAYNTLSVAAYRASGVVTTVTVLDGADDGPCADANGSVWTLDEAAKRPLEHPRCVRAFSPIVEMAQARKVA